MKKDAAIQEDVAKNVEDQVADEAAETEKPTLARDSVMDAIAKQRRETRNRDDVAEVDRLQQEDTEDEDQDEEPETPESDPQVQLKVDGEIIYRLQSEVDAAGGVAALQKQISGERRLDQAAKERQQLELLKQQQHQREQQLRQREAELERKSKELQTLANNPKNDVTHDDVAIVQDFLDGVYSGDEDKAKDAFSKVLSAMRNSQPKQQQPQIDPDKVAAEVEKRLTYKTSLEEGKREFAEKFAHLQGDKRLFEMTDQATARLRREHPDWSPKKIIMEAANEVDQWHKSIVGERSEEPNENRQIEERRQRKSKLDSVPAAQGRRPASPGYKPKSPAEILAQMRKSRSQ